MINAWTPETKSLLTALKASGFTIVSGDNGEDEFLFAETNVLRFIENLTACDEARLHVTAPDGIRCWLYIVLGNSPGELVSDYSCHPLLDKITEEHYDKWENQPQPKKEDRR